MIGASLRFNLSETRGQREETTVGVIVVHEKSLLIEDNVIPSNDFADLFKEVSRKEFRPVHALQWDKAWRIWDGFLLRGEAVYFDPHRKFAWRGATYPTL